MKRSRSPSWRGALLLSGVLLPACGDFAVGTETGNPSMDMTGFLPPAPTGEPIEMPGVAGSGPDPVMNTGGTYGGSTTPNDAGRAPVLLPGGSGPGSEPAAGGTPGVLVPAGGQTNGAAAGAAPTPSTGGTAGVFPGQPCDPTECAELASSIVSPLTTPAPAPEPFTSAECESGACRCETASGSAILVSPTNACAVTGRARSCIVEASEVGACEGAADSVCADACALAEQALTQDAAQTYDVAVVSAACVANGCSYAVRIEDQCYAGASLLPSECPAEVVMSGETEDAGAP